MAAKNGEERHRLPADAAGIALILFHFRFFRGRGASFEDESRADANDEVAAKNKIDASGQMPQVQDKIRQDRFDCRTA
jgi:hypothetical protein